MRLYKRGKTYWCSFYDAAGQRVRCTTRCTDLRAAQAAAARFEREAADPRNAAANATTLRTALERLLKDREARGRAGGTVSMYATKGGHLLRLLGADTPLAAIDAKRVDDFIDRRIAEGASRNTIVKELTTLRAALKVAKRRGEFLGDVAAVLPVQWSTSYKPRKRVLRSVADIQASSISSRRIAARTSTSSSRPPRATPR